MAMIVQHNLTAMNSNRQLGVITSGQAKSAEKLSSGYKINRAGDDAAGLKISEKMRSQVRGLQRASTNAQDGVSLIQTAEGALNEAHSILQRMNELAVQGANDTNQDIDREAINEELDALVKELDRISETTQFNKQELLDGSFQNKNLHVGANADQKIEISIDNMNADTLGLKSVTVTSTTLEDKQKGEKYTTANYKGMTYSYVASWKMSANMKSAITKFKSAISGKYTSSLYAVQGNGRYLTLDGTASYATVASAIKKDVSAAKIAMSTDIAANFEKYLGKEEITASKALSTTTTTTGNVSVSNYDAANASIKAIQEAINKVSTQRSALGALQNRLEHTIANLDNVAENTQAAESRIRDTDMASEMVEYSKNNILAQAGQSMLAQANQATQGVLSLLQ